MTMLTSQAVLMALAAIGVLLLFFYGYVLRSEGRQDAKLTAGQVFLLWVLRITVALLVLVALMKPAYEQVQTQERLPVVPILVDESLSMGLPDSRDNPLLADRPGDRSRWHTAQLAVEKLSDKLSRTHRVRVYTFSDALSLLREAPHRTDDGQPALTAQELFASHARPTGDYSNLGDGLVDVLRDLSGEKISGVVLISDGRQTGGEELSAAAQQAASAKLPVHTVTLGTEFPLRDLRIDEVIAGAEASLGDVLTFHVKVTNQISSPLTTELVLEEQAAEASSPDAGAEFRTVSRRKLSLARGQVNVPISMIPETEGLRRFRFSLPQQEDEVNTANNTAEVTVRVVKRTLKVLLIAGQPSREFLFMVPGLLRDPIIDLSCYLQGADVDYTQQGNSVIERLPGTVAEWSRYDVAVLFDVDPNGISTQQLAGLENMVSNGGGLMIIAGRNHGLAKLVQVHAARIRGLLPVEVDKNLHLDHDRYYDTAFHAARTTTGRSHPVLLASSEPTLNEQVWTTFEGLDFYWYHPVSGAKPKSIVLLERTDVSSGSENCLMAIHRYVDGAVFFSALDSVWMWRYPYESYDYDRLWTRIIRYLGEARLLGTQQQVSLTTDRRSYSPGEDVEIQLRMLDPALLAQLAGQPTFVAVTGEDQDQYMVPMSLDPRGEPLYRGAYRARRLGTMSLLARQAAPDADSEAKPLFEVSHSFQVKMQSLEDVDTSADLAGMQTLAETTGGKYYDYRTMSELDKLPEAIPAEPQILTEVTVREMWDGLNFLGLFLVLVVSELSLRKWWGLL